MNTTATPPAKSKTGGNTYPKRDHRLTRTVAEGFVRIMHPDEQRAYHTKETQFFGLFAPGNHAKSGNLVGRSLVVSRNAPPWFNEFVQKLMKENRYDFLIRMRIVGISEKAPLAMVMPCARMLKTAEQEFARYQEEHLHEKYAIDEFPDADKLGQYVHEQVAKKANGIITRHNDDGSSLMLVPSGDLVRLTGGSAVWNFTDGIAKKTTTLEAEIALAVDYQRVLSI